MIKQLIPAVALFALAGTAAQAQAPTVIYDNIDGADYYYGDIDNGGATKNNLNTIMVADDINPIDGTAGDPVTGFSFFVTNDSNDIVTADVRTSFYDDTSPDYFGAGPGSYIGGVDFGEVTLAPGELQELTYPAALGTTVFTVPTDQDFWAGVSFSANPGTSADDLNLLGQAWVDFPDIGGSDNMVFGSDLQGSNTFDDPPGGEATSYDFGGDYTTPLNFAWQFSATPEPSQYASLGLGVLGIGALALRARKRRVTAE